jgi:cytochrome c5
MTHHWFRRGFKRGVMLGACAAIVWLAGSPAGAQPAGNALPAGEGRDLLTAACTQCHGLGTIMAMRDGTFGWKAQVANMVLRGAQLTSAETDAVVKYLAANFGPGAPRPAGADASPVALPDGAGKDLVETRCALCHDLGRVVAIRRPKSDWDRIVANMASRGAPVSADETRTIAAYLAERFGG